MFFEKLKGFMNKVSYIFVFILPVLDLVSNIGSTGFKQIKNR